jgi:hypothetical protein
LKINLNNNKYIFFLITNIASGEKEWIGQSKHIRKDGGKTGEELM